MTSKLRQARVRSGKAYPLTERILENLGRPTVSPPKADGAEGGRRDPTTPRLYVLVSDTITGATTLTNEEALIALGAKRKRPVVGSLVFSPIRDKLVICRLADLFVGNNCFEGATGSAHDAICRASSAIRRPSVIFSFTHSRTTLERSHFSAIYIIKLSARRRVGHLAAPRSIRAAPISAVPAGAGGAVYKKKTPPVPLRSKEIDASQAERLGRSCLSIVPRSRLHVRFRRNATMSHAFSCMQPVFIDL
ncbi:hypothetical protein EVAR_23833_1 [Eumeta japonica]|uniref:Uncharacterized protein n=1 Tax=Eumeta variegata TaxID=151549 RepID=A0A4C1VM56_EUMVA|nr:hypothetical protein EVAR_23833_1 [Eumeta japonica]